LFFFAQEAWSLSFLPRQYSQSSEFYQAAMFLSLCVGLVIWWLKTSLPRAIRDKRMGIIIVLLVLSGAMIYPVIYLSNFMVHEYKPHGINRR
jgi:hypothetical protein